MQKFIHPVLGICTKIDIDFDSMFFAVKKMNIETQCDVNVTGNINIRFNSMFSMLTSMLKFFQILSISEKFPVSALQFLGLRCFLFLNEK